jgi:hypothetical protein
MKAALFMAVLFHLMFLHVLISLFFFKKMMGYQNNLQKLDLVCRLSQTSLSFSQKDQ